MSLTIQSKQKKLFIIEGFVVFFVVAIVFATVLQKVFATTAYYLTDATVELDGTNDGGITLALKSPIEARIFSVEGEFPIGRNNGSFDEFTLTELTPGGGIASDDYRILSNEPVDGRVFFQDGSSRNPMVVGANEAVWNMTFVVNKDTAAGNYELCVNGLRISREIADNPGDSYPTENIGNLCGTVTVTRNEVPVEKPTQVVTFRDGNGNPITEITKYYGDEDFKVTKEVTTGDGAFSGYAPDDGESEHPGSIVVTKENDMVGVNGVGEVNVCAWVGGTDNYAATKACYTVHVQKRPLDIKGVTIAPKTYDGTDIATVTSVSFEDRDLNNDEYTVTNAFFEDTDADEDVVVHVSVELTGGAENNYILNASNFDTTASIAPFTLTAENAELWGGTTYVYNPDGVEPEVRVTANVRNGISTLEKGTDYEVSYSDNLSVGTGHVAISGLKNFTTGDNPLVLDFTITAKGINNSNLVVPTSIVEGRILEADDISVNVDGRELVRCASAGNSDCDYVLEFSDNDGVVGHSVHVAVNACNNYDGAAVADVAIVAKSEQTVTIADVTNTTVNKTYGDEDFTYAATSDGGGEISYRSTNEAVATVDNGGKVTIVGVGDTDIIATAAETDTHAEGSAKYTVSVAKKVVTITDATVSNKVYDGTPVATVMNVVLSESSLVYNTDYTATALFNDVDVAIRSVEVMVALTDDQFAKYCFMHESSCIKNTSYSTTATITPFTLGADNATADLTANSFVYSGSEKTPGATVKADLDGDGIKETTLTSETDYDMSYENNINRGTGSATVLGKGNYAGSLTGLEFEIISAPVENVVVTAPSQDYTGEALEPVPTVTGEINGSSMTFNAGDYYVIPHADFKNAGSYTFSVKSVNGGNYYFDSTDGSFTINQIASGNPAEMTAGLKIAAGCTLAELGERTAGFAWANPNSVVGAGNQTFPATYLQNNDSTNYTPISVDVPIYGLKRLSVATAIMGEGGEVTNPGDLAVEEDELTWTISPDEGYELESFVINSEDKTSEVSGGRFTMTAGTESITAIVRFRKVYEVTRGAGQTHNIGVDGDAEFEIDADYYELFEGIGTVYVDGVELGTEDYDAWSGSTVISLKAAYLDTLAVGEHLLEVHFDDGGIARTSFTIVDPTVLAEDTPGAADTGVFTGATGGAIAATGATVIVLGLVAGVVFVMRKKQN